MRRRPATVLGQGRNLLLASFACLLLLTGCTVKLAPDFDRSIVDGLIKTNEQTLVHFAAVSSGVEAATFDRREATYNSLIGKFDALRLQVLSRPTPRPMVAKWLGIGSSEDSEPNEIEVLKAPTDKILEKVIDTLTRMKSNDRAKGLKEGIVKGFKGSYEISIDQALTYEKALER